MSKKHSSSVNVAALLIPAVLYLRMSSDDQEGSIEQQRKELLAWAAAHGYRIVREYIDSGKSGSKDTHKRVAFRQMVADSGKREWEVILVWKVNRFGRLDSIEGAEDKKTLRGNGVRLVSMNEGVIDWNTLEGRILDAVQSEMNAAYSASLASDSLRGRLAALEAGNWPNGSVPYGYHRLYLSPDGREVLVKRTEPFRKPTGWRLVLVVCEEEAEVIRLIYDLLVNRDWSMRAIAEELNDRGVPSPAALGRGAGKGWTLNTLTGKRGLISNPAYVGVGYCGAGRTSTPGKFDLAGDVRRAGVCPVIVDPALWEQAQAVLAKRKLAKRRPVKGSGALSGVLYCAHCGYRLAATIRGGKVHYVCNTQSLRPGKFPCRQWSVREEDLLPAVCSQLVTLVDGELVKALHATPPAADRMSDLDALRQRMATLEKQAAEAGDRYLRAPAALMPMLEQRLEALRKELAECEDRERELAAAAGQGAVANFAKWWEGVRGRLILAGPNPAAEVFWRQTRENTTAEEGKLMLEALPGGQHALADPAPLRSLLVRLGVRVACTFADAGATRKKVPGRGRGLKYVLRRAVMTVPGEGGEKETGVALCGDMRR